MAAEAIECIFVEEDEQGNMPVMFPHDTTLKFVALRFYNDPSQTPRRFIEFKTTVRGGMFLTLPLSTKLHKLRSRHPLAGNGSLAHPFIVWAGGIGVGASTAVAAGAGAGVVAQDDVVIQRLQLLGHMRPASQIGANIYMHLAKVLAGKEPRFLNLRPTGHRSVVPVQLAVPPFQHIISAAWGASEGPAQESLPRDKWLVNQLCAAMSEAYSSDDLRVTALMEVLQECLAPELKLRWIKASPAQGACDITAQLASSPTTLLFVEVKNEIGSSGDPGFQGAAHYARYIRDHPQLASLLATSFGPAVLVEVVGALLRIQGLAFVGGHVVCEPLTPFLNMVDIHDRQSEQALMLARCVCALRRTLSELVVAAGPQVATAAIDTQPAWGNCALPMPHHLHLLILAGDVERVRAPFEDRLLYRAAMPRLPDVSQDPGESGSQMVVIKYVRRYGREVHEAWAAADLAPRLLRCRALGVGPWLEVVMAWLDPAQGWLPLTAFLRDSTQSAEELQSLRDPGMASLPAACKYCFALAASVSTPQVTQLLERVEDAVKEAHKVLIPGDEPAGSGTGKHGVHGDIRPPNVLLQLPIPATFQDTSAGPAASCLAGAAAAEEAAKGSAAVEAGVSAAASLDVAALRVVFVDFDWAGVEGEARYPAQLNPHIKWVHGTEPGGLIQRRHDLNPEKQFPRYYQGVFGAAHMTSLQTAGWDSDGA